MAFGHFLLPRLCRQVAAPHSHTATGHSSCIERKVTGFFSSIHFWASEVVDVSCSSKLFPVADLRMRLFLSVTLLALAALAAADQDEVRGKRVLALLESLTIRDTHSIFFKTLTDAGFTVTYKSADDASINLKKYGSWLFDHLILFSPSVEDFGGTLSVEGVAEFVDEGGNVLVAGSKDVGDVLREVAAECGFEADEEGAEVIDHLNFDTARDGGDHTTVVAQPGNLIKSDKIVGKSGAPGAAPFLYRGTGLIVDQENPLVLEILTASSSAYSYRPGDQVNTYPHAVGKNTVLIAGLQAHNNARVVFSGSLDFFSDEFFTSAVSPSNGGKRHETSGNRALAAAVASWCFKQTGVLRVKGVQHHLEGEKEPPALFYTIREDVVYSIDIEEMVGGKWVPYKANDVQVMKSYKEKTCNSG